MLIDGKAPRVIEKVLSGCHEISRIYLKKKNCGMGFKKMRDFNISMLGKMAWKFITNSQSHVVRIYKARYFPHYSFMEANLGANPSYIWHSILEAKQIVCAGSHIRFGDGKNTNIWGDPRLPSVENGIINSSTQLGLEEAKVSGLMKVNERVWDPDVLRDLFF